MIFFVNKMVNYLCFIAQAIHSYRFIKLRLKYWSQMDSFFDALTTFLWIESDICIGNWRYLSDFITNILQWFETTWGWLL